VDGIGPVLEFEVEAVKMLPH